MMERSAQRLWFYTPGSPSVPFWSKFATSIIVESHCGSLDLRRRSTIDDENARDTYIIGSNKLTDERGCGVVSKSREYGTPVCWCVRCKINLRGELRYASARHRLRMFPVRVCVHACYVTTAVSQLTLILGWIACTRIVAPRWFITGNHICYTKLRLSPSIYTGG